MSINFLCVTLWHMSIGGRVVGSVTFQEVDDTPCAEAAADSHRAVISVGWQSIFGCFILYPFVHRRKVTRGNIHFVAYFLAALFALFPRVLYCLPKSLEVVLFYRSFCHIHSPSYILLFPFLLGHVYILPITNLNSAYFCTCYYSLYRI